MFEHRHEALLPRPEFQRRLLRHFCYGLILVAVCLGIGMIGYHVTEGLSWLDAFLNAAMILSGMGPVHELQSASGKLFAGCYALFSGVAFLAITAILFAPVIHRFLHKFHLDMKQ